MTLSTEFTELPRDLAISSLEKPRAFRWKIRASSGVSSLRFLAADVPLDRSAEPSQACRRETISGPGETRRGSPNLHRAAPVDGHADALQRLPGVAAKLLDRSRLAFPFLDPARRLLEDLGDLHFVLDWKPSSEPRQESLSALSRRSSGLPSASSSPNFRRLSIRSPSRTWPLGDAGQGNDASVGPPEEKRTALSGFGPDPRSIGLERAIARRTIQWSSARRHQAGVS